MRVNDKTIKANVINYAQALSLEQHGWEIQWCSGENVDINDEHYGWLKARDFNILNNEAIYNEHIPGGTFRAVRPKTNIKEKPAMTEKVVPILSLVAETIAPNTKVKKALNWNDTILQIEFDDERQIQLRRHPKLKNVHKFWLIDPLKHEPDIHKELPNLTLDEIVLETFQNERPIFIDDEIIPKHIKEWEKAGNPFTWTMVTFENAKNRCRVFFWTDTSGGDDSCDEERCRPEFWEIKERKVIKKEEAKEA